MSYNLVIRHHIKAGRGKTMKEKRYFISDAAKELEVESHVLRYWEEELNLDIPRNEMGHRYYREEEIQMLQCIKELKARGFQLKTIKQILLELQEGKGQAVDRLNEMKKAERAGQETRGTEETILRDLHRTEKEQEPKMPVREEEVSDAREVSDKVVPIHTGGFSELAVEHDQKMQEFEEIMGRIIGHAMKENSHILGREVGEQVSGRVVKDVDYLLRMREEREEKRFQNLDSTIRQYQRAKKEVAAARMDLKPRSKKKKKSRFFQKRGRRTI